MAAGTYAAVKVLNPSAAQLYEYIKKNKLPQSTEDQQALHCTLIWSRVECPNMESNDATHRARPKELHVFRSEGKKRLVLLLDAPTLVQRHKKLMREHRASYDFAEYHPHITIAYNIDEHFEWWRLPSFKYDILLGEENVRAGNDRTITTRPTWKTIQRTLLETA